MSDQIKIVDGNEQDEINLCFDDIPSEDTVYNLTNALENYGFQIDKRRPDGRNIVWTCTKPRTGFHRKGRASRQGVIGLSV